MKFLIKPQTWKNTDFHWISCKTLRFSAQSPDHILFGTGEAAQHKNRETKRGHGRERDYIELTRLSFMA
jgi:hypothetical protein